MPRAHKEIADTQGRCPRKGVVGVRAPPARKKAERWGTPGQRAPEALHAEEGPTPGL